MYRLDPAVLLQAHESGTKGRLSLGKGVSCLGKLKKFTTAVDATFISQLDEQTARSLEVPSKPLPKRTLRLTTK